MVDVMAFGAHPDDIEFGCGAVLAKMAAEGKLIVMVDLTHGEKGTKGTPEIRRKESLASAKIIGAKRIFLDFADCGIIDSDENREKLVRVIREYKPKLILGPMWKGEQNHPDHLAVGTMLRYAARFARFAKVVPELPIHKPEGILHYIAPNHDAPIDFLVDVSAYVETWKKMMACHASQMQGFDYADWSLRVASHLGLMIDKAYAQGFVKGNPIEIDDLFTVAKCTREL